MLGAALALSAWSPGCESSGPGFASARVVTTRSQLVGGDRALGDVGDFLLENDKVRVVVQAPGFSRGFGVYGGSLIDADLRRPFEQGSSGAASGYDAFGELFPMFFVQATAVDDVRVTDDGSRGGAAKVVATGEAGDFLELIAVLNRAVTGSNTDYLNPGSPPKIRYSTTYQLAPGKRYVTIDFKVENISGDRLEFPGKDAKDLLGLLKLSTDGFSVPVGEIALYGAASETFIPGVGFDLRFGLEDSYKRKVDFPAFPGIVAEFVASRGHNISYGLIPEESDRNFAYNKRAIYEDGKTPITKHSIHIPFAVGSFVGLFYAEAPPVLDPKQSFEVRKYFVLGSGDVGSVLDTILEIRGEPTGGFGGQALDAITGAAATGASVLVYQRPSGKDPRIFSQYDVRANGFFAGRLPPGDYGLKIQGKGRPLGPMLDFRVEAGRTTFVRAEAPLPGRIVVRVLNEQGDGLPAKASAVGRYDKKFAGQLTRNFLFDLQAGEPFRGSDMIEDDPARPDSLRYIEDIGYTSKGTAELFVRPGDYDVYGSRGPEYDRAITPVHVGPGETATVTQTLHRVVLTPGWISADTHIHSRNSIDSPMTLSERVRSLAAEGLEWAVATDHNYVTDYAPFVAQNDLGAWLFPSVGVEMTTLESGHFNGYPLNYQAGPITHGAFEWARKTPDDIFGQMRRMGRLGPDRTIIQVNHPRDQVLGYWSQYTRSTRDEAELPPNIVKKLVAPSGPAFRRPDGATTFSLKYDAVELLNGKLFWEIHHYRVPDPLPPGQLPATIPPTGTVLRNADGEVAFPGVVDDWFNLLNLGYRFVGLGSGDSHSPNDEAGQFRSFIHVGDDRPAALTEEAIVAALDRRRVVATNGPLLDLWVNDPVRGPMGSTLADPDGQVTVGVSLTAAPWISIARLNVYRNGLLARSITVDQERDLAALPLRETFDLPMAKDAAGGAFVDSWFVVEAIGYRSLFPIVKPLEVPPAILTDALASLAGPLGLANDAFGALRPAHHFPVTAYAVTNPVWVTTGGPTFRPPGVVPIEVQSAPENDPKFQSGLYYKSTTTTQAFRVREDAETTIHRHEVGIGRAPLFYPRADNPFDVRKALSRMGHMRGHSH